MIGKTISHYKILKLIAEGGMGEVYLVEQSEPVKRQAALKIIKLGMDTKQIIARFEAERQALAVMSHPNIAKVFDAGTTDSGRPYFVMEYVPGISILEYCNTHKLSTKDRLKLFIPVCHGIQHAHQKGVIHRDLKPSNVLVMVQDGKPVPKVIDFGIAKAMGYRLTDKTLVTDFGEIVGTPAYMSPEQVEMSGLDVDTRTDIYSLGVMLYELLIGILPFEAHELGIGGYIDKHMLRETDPLTPSTRFKNLGSAQDSIAKERQSDPTTLQRQMKGDLDWITMKAMDKDRTRRYETANGLAMDIERYLIDEPVLAGPPSTTYRFKKYIRRNKTAVIAAGIVILAMCIAITGTSIGFVKATKAEKKAKEEAATATQVTDFLVNLFEVSEPDEAQGKTITAQEILEKGAERIDTELKDEPLIQARLQATIGRVYEEMGLFDDAAPMKEKALNTRRKQLGENHIDVAQSLGALGDLYRKQGKYAEAEPLLKKSLKLHETLLGKEHTDVANSLNTLAVLYENSARYAEAEPLYARALSIQEKEFGKDDPKLAMVLTNLAILKARQGKYTEAEPLFQRVLRIDENELGQDHPRVATDYNNLAIAYKLQEKYEEAEPLYRRALEIQEKVLGHTHPAVARSLNNLANLYFEQKRYTDAEPLYRQSLEISEELLGPEHPTVGLILDNLARLYVGLGKYLEAETAYLRAIEIRENALGPDHHELATNLHNLGNLYNIQGLYEKAESLYKQSLSIMRKILDLEHPDLRLLIEDYVTLLRTNGREEEASALERDLAEHRE